MARWKGGHPRDEVAFMNHVTGRLARKRNKCDVGVEIPVGLRSEVATLHRQGPNQQDLYGADLAITIYLDSPRIIKTAFFQLKKSQGYSARIERAQIDQAKADSRIHNRSYVPAIDELRDGVRIRHIKDVESEFQPGADSRTVKCAGWQGAAMWARDWFSCDTGPISDPNDPKSVEALLKAFVQDEDWESPWASRSLEFLDVQGLGELVPARNWMVFHFTLEEPSS